MKRFRHIIFVIILLAGGLASYLYFTDNEFKIENIKDEKKADESLIKVKDDSNQVEEKTVSDVPFTSQAPYAEWDNSIFQDGCEEASSLMAVYWALGMDLNKETARREIISISEYEKDRIGVAIDTSAQDTADLIIGGYFNYNGFSVENNISLDEIIAKIKERKIILAPVDGRDLENPFFTSPGPVRHMLLIYAYDEDQKEFITNDPGTKRGKAYRYDKDLLYHAIRDYPTGNHLPIEGREKNIIVVWK